MKATTSSGDTRHPAGIGDGERELARAQRPADSVRHFAALTTWRVSIPFGFAVAGTLIHLLWVVLGQSPGTEVLAHWVYNGALAAAAISCFARATCGGAIRFAWIAFGGGLLSWTLGDVYYYEVLDELEAIPFPSWADVGFLGAIPCFFVGIASMIKYRIGHFSVANWLDGAIAALGAAALATALIAPALVDLTLGDPATVLVNLAYPLGYLMLIAMIAGVVGLSGLRGAKPLLLIAFGIFLWAAVDVLYLYQLATGTYRGGLIDTVWPTATLFMAGGAYFALESRPRGKPAASFRVPGLFTVAAILLLVWDHSFRTSDAAVYLAAGTILASVLRLALSFRDNTGLVRLLEARSATDSLTGMANRRSLLEDLEGVFKSEKQEHEKLLFALFDLDGFKTYNDNFGHPAGDALLRRLGGKLVRSVGENGTAYRLGGDEFCVLVELGDRAPAPVFEKARTALAEREATFTIGASGGWVYLDEAASPASALHIVDQRMYAEKTRWARSGVETQAVLMRVFREREPLLSYHSEVVGRLAIDTGRDLSLGTEDLDVIYRAAELHDVGKIAIPDDILQKPGPLDEAEWDLMRSHTLIGSRILGGSPAMKPVGDLVRSSHEWWNGTGYPDRLAGEDIPLGARIIAICDAFDAMTQDRPYQASVSIPEAMAELRRCAGTQFDPDLVEVVCRTIARSSSADSTTGLVPAGLAAS